MSRTKKNHDILEKFSLFIPTLLNSMEYKNTIIRRFQRTQTSQSTTKSRRRIKEFGPLSTKDANRHIKRRADVEGGREQKRHTKEMEKKAAEEEHLYIEAGMADLPPPILSDE